jgi:hypothetical protein
VGKQIEGARLVDLAPTILGVLGIRPTLAMDGAFLQALFQPEEADKILKNLPSEGMDINGAGSEITTEEAELIAEQLKALGYL